MRSQRIRKILLSLAVPLAGAAALPSAARAGSCCGGGGSTATVLPRAYRAMVDLSVDLEKYDGFWNQDGEYTEDPSGSDLRQYRLNGAVAYRLGRSWQAGLSSSYIWNDNEYAEVSSRSRGVGDTTVSVWYEAYDDLSAWTVKDPRDLIPSVTVGVSLLAPTGVSPYDDVDSSFDVTGRGFYRLDANLLLEKTLYPWSGSLSLSYGKHFERSVNREYGKYVEPYRKSLGDRFSGTAALSYIYFLTSAGDTLTATASCSVVREGDGTIDDESDSSSSFQKAAFGAALAYSSTDHDWSFRASWTRALRRDGWGENFPTTDVYTVGVRYAFR